MKRRNPHLWAAIAVGFAFWAAQGARAEIRDFTSLDGQTLRAELMSHKAGKVKLRRSDGKEFEVEPKVFSVEDQLFLREWMQKTPESVSYRFRFEVEKEKLEGARQNLGYKIVKNEKWAYRINVTNLSRDTVRDITVKYRIFFSNQADGNYSASSSESAFLSQVEGEVKLTQSLGFNRGMEFLTKAVDIDLVDYDGAGSRYKDSLKGCMVRVLDPMGNTVEDWVMPVGSLSGKTWESTSSDRSPTGRVIIR